MGDVPCILLRTRAITAPPSYKETQIHLKSVHVIKIIHTIHKERELLFLSNTLLILSMNRLCLM